MVESVLCKFAIATLYKSAEISIYRYFLLIFLLYISVHFFPHSIAFMTLHITPSLGPFLPLGTFAHTFPIWT